MFTRTEPGLSFAATSVLASLLLLAAAGSGFAQDPETRADELRRRREEKSKQLEAPEPTATERLLLDLERGRLFERILNPAEGLYPKLGSVTAGSGFSFGPAFRLPGWLGGHADVSAFAMASFKKYWMIETRLRMPRLADERVVVDLHAQRYDFPEEPFFGLGPASVRSDEVSYGYRNMVVGGSATYAPTRWFSASAGTDYLTPRVGAFDYDGAGADGSADEMDDDVIVARTFDDALAPGLAMQPDYLRYEASADVNFREPRGNPRAGGRYALTWQRYDDRDGGLFSFQRVEADLQHYVSLLRNRRVLAFRALASLSDADEGARVPFYLQRTLGGPDDLRGFRRSRFRDRHALLLQAEYRWEIFTAVDGAIFYDAGKVASRVEDLNLRDLESDYGIGFRFGTKNGVFLRVEGAFGSSGGKHFIFRFGHVF
jgi:outer membrane protein assembly factor BamA